MRWIFGSINFLLVTIVLVSAFNPSVNVEMCTETELTLTLEGAENGGIIYIQGHSTSCKQNTVNVTTEFVFVFGACGVDPYQSFSIIVQKKPHYQTGYDLVFPVRCLYELSIELSGNELNLEGVDEVGVNITLRPTATMTIYSNGQEVTAGQVRLTDTLTMSIQLGSEFIADFDLKARYCTANTIELIQDFCSTDVGLFPNFVQPVQGIIATSFGAFRTTALNGGIVDMTFSCTLQLCFGACSQTNCANGEVGYGRRKRLADKNKRINKESRRNKRMADEDVAFQNVNVGASISVGETFESFATGNEDDQICIPVILLLMFGTLGSFIVFACVVVMTSVINKYRKRKQPKQSKKEESIPEVTPSATSVSIPVPNSRFGTTTRRFSGQFIPV
ncbi:uncharacterized protein LOC132554456 [Ylistrum balloti]|uniref:uncharacterized protein LOC132554456 n=1 Tax=Ylistrum balloti TaxID=509963 RepID=UPI0029058C1E|nr:uncharacterized protein LOC132554456 [Ylistrum balloti]